MIARFPRFFRSAAFSIASGMEPDGALTIAASRGVASSPARAEGRSGGVSEAGQSDYTQQGFTSFATQLMGGTALDDPDAYRRASPIDAAPNFRDRLLLLHGALDGTVPIQQAMLISQRLLDLKKRGWDLAIYPLEGHVAQFEVSRLDMERRRFAFFEEVLKGPR